MTTTILDLVGNTPLVKIGKVYTKLESMNPSGSIKDRMALYMTLKAEKLGKLRQGMEIVEATSGNTGISFAMVSAVKGYKFTAVMPENMSVERRGLIKSYGANLILTPAEKNMAGALEKFDEIKRRNKNAWYPMQFENPDNTEAHRMTTGKEIIKELGKVDVFVAGVGTGGTLMGVAQALKELNPRVRIVGVEPSESAVMSGKKAGTHGIQGIGEGFIPPLVDMKMIDEVVAIKTEDSIRMAKELCTKHGVFVGISSGANFLAAKKFVDKFEKVVTVLPDSGNRYLSIYSKSE